MEERTHELRALLKKTFLEWCRDSKCHGVMNIVKAQNLILKVIWLLCFLTCSGFCIYLITLALLSYFSNPITTKISVVDDTPATFPTVSICFLNPLNSDNDAINTEIADLLATLNKTNSSNQIFIYQVSASRKISYFLSNLNTSQKLAYGNTLDNSMLFCKFNSKPCDKSGLFEWYFDFNLGNCYKFNPEGKFQIGKAGFLPSLQLQFIIGDSSTVYSGYFESGMRILIHNSSLSQPLVYENGISLAPGFNYDLKVSRTFYSRLDAPYSNCLKDLSRNNPDLTHMMDVMFNALNLSTYNQQYCQNLAFQRILATNCSCVNPAYPFSDPNVTKCITGDQVGCQDNMFQIVYKDPDFYFGENCPQECDYFDYDVQVSQSAYPTEWYYNNTLDPRYATYNRRSKINSYQEARNYYLSFNIYYDQLAYQLIEEDPFWDIVLLLSNFGGSLGLFVGMSILTFVEVIELAFQLIEYIIIDFFNRRRKAKVSSVKKENEENIDN